ncbi:MAG: acyl carrier protein [Clostridiales bacterium]|jgi:hypothetical protein|uniref:Acyl carrier protein n=1 Tax=Candidatus Egerieisoma faecipullorum TaxID=2840963 RepID=A0A9D1I7S8_9CLOT|nr:acyl carrier protein [Clostridiales bacterium]HBV53074.1 acyl carrier protein [Clostridiales bacterium]HIU29726.1 acyl carrier protein [Candidatus Egerieisoma faecipullorum]
MEELIRILQSIHPDVDYKTNDRLIEDKILDSFDIITLISEINEEFGVAIPAEEIVPENFNSAEKLYDLILRLEE